MAISIVTDGGGAGTQVSPGPNFTFDAAAGQAVIVAGLCFSTAPGNLLTGISDNAGGNTWVFSTSIAQFPPLQHFAQPVNGGYGFVFVGWCLSLANTINHVSALNSSGLNDFWRVSMSSWTGIVSADGGAGNTYTSTSTPQATVSCGNSGDLVIGVANNDATSFTGPPTGGSGWTDFTGTGASTINLGYIYPQAAGNYTAEWTLSGSDNAATAVQAFSPVPPTPPPSSPGVLYSMRSFP